MSDSSQRERLVTRVLPVAGAAALKVLASTWRLRVEGAEHLEAARRAGAFIFALWHGELLPLLWLHRDQDVVLLISEHRDGELVARAARRLGYQLVRGSTTRGGARALLEVVTRLERGQPLAITPDGPRGPRHRFTPGAAVAAHRAGVPILPVRAAADHAWRLRSWDRFLVPKPFCRLRVAYGPPTWVAGATAADAEQQVDRFEALLHSCGARIGADASAD